MQNDVNDAQIAFATLNSFGDCPASQVPDSCVSSTQIQLSFYIYYKLPVFLPPMDEITFEFEPMLEELGWNC